MLGFILSDERGASDRLIASTARHLAARGLRVAGFIQVNTETATDLPCDMDLVSVDGTKTIRISQDLGRAGHGCRLDTQGLEAAVGHTKAMMEITVPDLLIVNKFGRQEAEGRGFRLLIGEAVASGIPVLTAVSPRIETEFARFAQGMEMRLPADTAKIMAWCEKVTAIKQTDR